MLHGQNLEVYERMGESLREELKVLQMQQRTWDDTHAAACRAEVAVLEQQLGKASGALEPLQRARADLEKQTEQVLHAFFVGEMAELRTQNRALTQQLGAARAKALDTSQKQAEAVGRHRARAKEGLAQAVAAARAEAVEEAKRELGLLLRANVFCPKIPDESGLGNVQDPGPRSVFCVCVFVRFYNVIFNVS